MQRHTKIYFRYYQYGEQDNITCEVCGSKAVDIHHINGRGKGKDIIENLIGLCRDCHDKAHQSKLSKALLTQIHSNNLKSN